MKKATTKELSSSYVCALFSGHRLCQVNEAITRGEKFAQIELTNCSCYTTDYAMQSGLEALHEKYNAVALGEFYARTGKRTFIVSYEII